MAAYKQKILFILIFLLFAFVANASAGTKEFIQQREQKTEYIEKKPSIVFLITKDSNNYEAHNTVPLFADMLSKEYGYKVTVLLGAGDHGSYRYPSTPREVFTR